MYDLLIALLSDEVADVRLEGRKNKKKKKDTWVTFKLRVQENEVYKLPPGKPTSHIRMEAHKRKCVILRTCIG